MGYQEELDPEDVCEGEPSSTLENDAPPATPDPSRTTKAKTGKAKQTGFKLNYDQIKVKSDVELVSAEEREQTESADTARKASGKKERAGKPSKRKSKQRAEDEDSRRLEQFLGSDYVANFSGRNDGEYDEL